MSENKKTCNNCKHCVPVSEDVYACKIYNDDVLQIELETETVAKTCEGYTPVPEMATFKVPVVWTMTGFVDIALPVNEQPTMADAVQYARENIDEFSLPSGEYLDGSFEIDESACALDDKSDADEIEAQIEKIYLERQHKNDIEEVFDYADWDRHGEYAENAGFAFSPKREDFLLTDKEVDELATKIRAHRNDGDSFEGAYEWEVELIINKKKEHHEADVNAVKEYLEANRPSYIHTVSDVSIECIAYRTRYYIDNDAMSYSTAVPTAIDWFYIGHYEEVHDRLCGS